MALPIEGMFAAGAFNPKASAVHPAREPASLQRLSILWSTP